MTKRISMLLFDDVELLDFCGPYEVFSAANQVTETTLFAIDTVSLETPITTVRGGLSVNTDYSLSDAPGGEILLIPGGNGARALLADAHLIAWITSRADAAETVLSVCTGSLLLAKAQLLDGLQATTHHTRIPMLRELAPAARVTDRHRFVDNGKFIVSAGIAAGIDMSLHVVSRLAGPEAADATAAYMEYPWKGQAPTRV